jgi:hypothetical protein
MHEEYSPPRRGGVAARSKRSREASFIARRRGGQFGGNPRFRRSDHPVRSLKGSFATSLLMSRPPLLCEEGNVRSRQGSASLHSLKKCRKDETFRVSVMSWRPKDS